MLGATISARKAIKLLCKEESETTVRTANTSRHKAELTQVSTDGGGWIWMVFPVACTVALLSILTYGRQENSRRTESLARSSDFLVLDNMRLMSNM